VVVAELVHGAQCILSTMERVRDGDSAPLASPGKDAHGLFSPMGRGLGRLVGPRVKWVVVVLGVLLAGAAFAFAGAGRAAPTQASLPADAEAAQAAAIQASLPASGAAPAIIVISRDGQKLTDADRGAVAKAQRRGVAAMAEAGAAPKAPGAPGSQGGQGTTSEGAPGPGPSSGSGPAGVQLSQDGTTALAIVPLSTAVDDATTARAVGALRDAVRSGLPDGLTANVTGGPAFTTDIAKVFDGADISLLIATASVVAVLLLITYRSPWLWLVPLGVVGVGDQVASKSIDVLSRVTDVSSGGAVKGIVSVLVFGAGTNYALLLIARYREELRRHRDHHDAMRAALVSAAPAILASSSTVVLALLSLGLADDPFVTSLGYAGALGVVVALGSALLVLPAAMVLFGRWLFWPFVPRVGSADASHRGPWRRVGDWVTARPALVGGASVVVLAVLATGLVGLSVGQTPDEQFLRKPEAVSGQEQLARAFPAGSSAPVLVVAPSAALGEVQRRAEGLDGVVSVRKGPADARYASIDVVLRAEPGTDAALGRVEALRSDLAGTGAKVGGSDAELLDSRATASRDRSVLFPVILVIVLAVLLLLLRSVVAAVLLVATVVGTYVASMGASWFAFSHLLGYPPLAVSTPLLGFLFLVALGVDYNIFLTTRAREEATAGADAREAIVRALAVTGGVITSAGVLLAAVFAVLGVLPLVQLAQIGVIVGFGVLLDTLVVRSILVPSLVSLLGERFWWPSHPRR
jgi:putative drug exporter of the RND superfamily